jgi:hypothetical protein
MSVAKVIEISSTSPDSFEDAIRQGVSRASKTLKNIQGAWIKEQHRGGSAFRDSLAAWLRWILGSITPPVSPWLAR